MGTGKSSVGRALAHRTRLPRFDTDEMVTRKFSLPITEIFAQHGEKTFRDAEAAALAHVPRRASVIVTGGGAVLREGQVKSIRRLGAVVLLTADIETLFARLSRRSTRPLLQTEDPRKTIADLLQAREPLYREAADFSVDTSRLSHDEVALEVLAGVERMRADAS